MVTEAFKFKEDTKAH